MKDIIWEIAKATDSETNLDYTELGSIFQPRTLFEARGISYTAKDSTTRISKYVDSKLADDVKENGAIRINDTVFNYSKSYKTTTINVENLINFVTNKELSAEALENLLAIIGNNFVPKLRGLDAVAERKGMDKQVARDTFISKDWEKDPKLQVINTELNQAPKWAKSLNDNERLKRN